MRGWYLLGLLGAIFMLSPWSPSGPAASPASSQRSLPGGTVKVHGQRLAFSCRGRGSPAVVFEAGLTFDSTEWAGVQPQVAKVTRACSYDRLGEGHSDPVRSGVVQTVAIQARTLRAVLEAADIQPPYVLVGHSWGGAIVQRFAFTYRDTLAGIVLVDSSQADVIHRWLAMLPRAPKIGTDPFAEIRRALIDALKPSGNPEHLDWNASIPQLHALRSLGSLPLVVLTAGTSDIEAALPPPYAKRSYRIWSQAQSQLAALSSDSVHGVDTSAEHLIPTEDPGAVITAVKQVIRAARNHGRLPRCRTVFRGISGIRCV